MSGEVDMNRRPSVNLALLWTILVEHKAREEIMGAEVRYELGSVQYMSKGTGFGSSVFLSMSMFIHTTSTVSVAIASRYNIMPVVL